MASFVHLIDQRRLIGAGGSTTSGEIYFYYTGTTVKAPIYSDAALLTPMANPVVVAAGAIIPLIFLDDSIQYRRTIIYGDGSIPDTQDPIGNLLSDGDIGLPVGAVIDFSGTAAPEGFLFCFGQEISREDYEELFDTIGTQYGAGNGTTTFNLPDYRGRVGAGKDNMGGSAANRLTSPLNGSILGAAGGFQTAVITLANLPAHSHDIVITDPGHTHGVPVYGDGDPGNFIEDAGGGTLKTVTTGSSTTGITATSEEVGENVNHNNLQPTIVVNKIIKTASVSFLSILGVDLAEEAAKAVEAIRAIGDGYIAEMEDLAAAAQGGIDRFFATIAEGVAGTTIGGFFASAETGTTRIYLRTGTSPFYVDQGDGAAPVTVSSYNNEVGISVDRLGAVGSAIANDATVIAAANALAAALGGYVSFAKATYWTGPITLPNNVKWVSRTSSAIRPHSSTSSSAALITLGQNNRFEGLTFEDPSNVLSNEVSRFINGDTVVGLRVTSCVFQDMLARSIRVNGLTDGWITYCKFRRNRPHARLLDENSSEVYLVDNLSNVNVLFNDFEGLDTTGIPWGSRELAVIAIAVTSGTVATNVNIRWNTFKNYRRSFVVAGSDWEINSFKPVSGYFSIKDNVGNVCGMQAIKWKGAIRHDMSGNTMRGFERICHEVPDSLRGCYFLQITPETTFDNNKAFGDPIKLWQGNVVAATSTTVALPAPPAGTWADATFAVSGAGSPNSMRGKLLFIRSGTGAYQWRRITAYTPSLGAVQNWDTGIWLTVGELCQQGGVIYESTVTHLSGTFATDLGAGRLVARNANTATVAAWTTTPDATSVIEVWNNPSAGFIVRGNNGNSPQWATATAYVPGDTVITNNNVYVCDIAHTSGTFATDLTAFLWRPIDSADTRTARGFMGGTNHVEDCEVGMGLSGPMFNSNLGTFTSQNCAVSLRTYDPSAWAPSAEYVAGDFVHSSGVTYMCVENHTSGTFATDLTDVKWKALSYYRRLAFESFVSRYVNYPNPLTTASMSLNFIDVLSFGNLSISGAYRDCAAFNNVTGLTINAGRMEGAGQGRGDAGAAVTGRYAATFNSVVGQISNFTFGGTNAGAGQSFAILPQETNYANDIRFVNCDLTGNASVSSTTSGAFNNSFLPGAGMLFLQCKGAGAQGGVLSLTDAAATYVPSISGSTVVLNVPLTADQTLTLGTAGRVEGQEVVVRRTASSTGAFNLIVSGALETPVNLTTGSTLRLRYSTALTGWVRVS